MSERRLEPPLESGLNKWIEWAKEEIQQAKEEIQQLYREAVTLSQERQEAQDKAVALEKKCDDQDRVIKGLEAWVANRRKANLDVLAVGTKVYLKDRKTEGRVITVFIDNGGPSYEVRYFDGQHYYNEVLNLEDLVTPDEVEYLPINPTESFRP